MKRLNLIVCAALAIAAAASCDKDPVDFPIVGDLTLSASYNNYVHGDQGWIEKDALGVFVTSDGVAQNNLQYAPSAFCPLVQNQYVQDMSSYASDKAVTETTVLNAKGEKAGFKQGVHNIYVYTPYVASASDHKAVPMPDLTKQTGSNSVYGLFQPDPSYLFAYASKEVKEYSAAPVDLGEMTPMYCQMTLMSPEFADTFVGKKVTKITVSANVDIAATANSTFNFETKKIEGEMSKTVELTGIPAGGWEIAASYFGAGYGETVYVVLNIDFETGLNTEFTFTFTIDGTEYTAKAKPSASMSNDGNLNMHGALKL